MIFRDREDAGRQLAEQLKWYAGREDVVVLGIPRGGVSVAFEVARALRAPLDIFLSRKLGVPGHEEYAFGAVAAGNGRYLDEEIIRSTGTTEEEVERITREVRETLRERAALYRGSLPPLEVEGRTVILVDDGIATGASIYAAIQALREMKPARLVVAVPVAPASTCEWLKPAVDELVCLYAPKYFYAVGQFYERFSQVTDEEVIALLRRAGRKAEAPAAVSDCAEEAVPDSAWDGSQRDLSIPAGQVKVEGTLSLPGKPRGIILFAHGSGSSRHSPRNRSVAEALQSQGFATLLFDLLTLEEEAIDRQSAALRFDIGLLAGRLVRVTQWIAQNPDTRGLHIGYFGASTGAAAALVAAAQLPGTVGAVVSRGGRPDLAAEALRRVHAPTLLIVGGRDEVVIELNRQALAWLASGVKRLVIVPGATHLFEEPGALEEVARLAAEWFAESLAPARHGIEATASNTTRGTG